MLQQKIARYHRNGLIRLPQLLSARNNNEIVIDSKAGINFTSNDYLGFNTDSRVKKSFLKGVEKYGFGSGGSVAISGYVKEQQQFEEDFAEWVQRDRAVFFNSGYLANLGVMTVLANRNTTIISDRNCHASLLDAIQLSRAKHRRFHHQDLPSLTQRLQQAAKPCLIVTESIFSMEGQLTPVMAISCLAQQYQAQLILDDAHGIPNQTYYSQADVFCLVSPLGKAFGGVGAMVSGSSALIAALIQFARTYRYTTALPPAIFFALLEVLKLLRLESWRQQQLTQRIHYFIAAAVARNLPLISTDMTPIKSILIKDNHRALQLKNSLLAAGFCVACIRPPTVPDNTARIKISLNCHHKEIEIDQLLDIVAAHYEA